MKKPPYYAYGKSSGEDILRDTAYIVRLSSGCKIPPYMVIDDGWQIQHTETYNGGPWREGNMDYGDMKDLAACIAEEGAVPGIWFRPLYNNAPGLPDTWRLRSGYLDPSVPKVLDNIREDIRTICRWGFRLIKHDFTTFDMFGKWGFEMHPLVTDDGWHFYNRGLTGAEIVKNLYTAILEAAAPYGAYILGCDTVGHLGAGLMHIARTGDDTSGLGWERTRSVGVNTLAMRLMQNNTFFLMLTVWV